MNITIVTIVTSVIPSLKLQVCEGSKITIMISRNVICLHGVHRTGLKRL